MRESILSSLPVFYADIRDFVELAAAEDEQFAALEAAVRQLLDDQYVETSGLPAIRRRERMLGIQADPTTESIGFRKIRILNRYQTKPPFTRRWLQQQLDRIVGPGMTVVSVNYESQTLVVTAAIDNASVFGEVIHTIELVKPANMVYQQNTSLAARIGLKESIRMRPIAWNYGLGMWKLGVKPFSSLGPEVVMK